MPVVDTFGLINQVIDGQYRVERVVGEGGMSIVYRGLHLGLDEPVALKCLKLHASLDAPSLETFVRRFRDEGRLLYRLSQGNLDIVRSVASGTTVAPNTGALVPYTVLEWLEGYSLGADLRDRRSKSLQGRPLEEVIALFEPAAQALAYAHEQGVVHRDVKPGNLFFARSRAGVVRMKVLDFGLAKIMDETVGITMAATLGNWMMCSPRYAAPEQFDPRLGAIGPWTDVYSLVLVMLEVMRDKRVRAGEGLAACTVEALDAAAPVTCSALGLKVPSRIELLLARATAQEVKTRPQSVGALWSELTEIMSRRGAQIPGMRVDLGAATIVSAPPVFAPQVNFMPGRTVALEPPMSQVPSTQDMPTPRIPTGPPPAVVQPSQPGVRAFPPVSALAQTVTASDAAAAPPPTQPFPGGAPGPGGTRVSAQGLVPGAPPHAQGLPFGQTVALAQPSPVAAAPSAPAMGFQSGSTAPLGQRPMHPPVSEAPLPAVPKSRGPFVLLVLLLVAAVLAGGGYFGWRWWRAHPGVHLVGG